MLRRRPRSWSRKRLGPAPQRRLPSPRQQMASSWSYPVADRLSVDMGRGRTSGLTAFRRSRPYSRALSAAFTFLALPRQELIRSRAIIADEMNRVRKLEQLVAQIRQQGEGGATSMADTSLGLENIIQASHVLCWLCCPLSDRWICPAAGVRTDAHRDYLQRKRPPRSTNLPTWRASCRGPLCAAPCASRIDAWLSHSALGPGLQPRDKRIITRGCR